MTRPATQRVESLEGLRGGVGVGLREVKTLGVITPRSRFSSPGSGPLLMNSSSIRYGSDILPFCCLSTA